MILRGDRPPSTPGWDRPYVEGVIRTRPQVTTTPPTSHRLCVAPMMEWTDRHERYFLRLIARKVRL